MGQFKAQLENEIGILQAVADLARHSGDSERDVSVRLAGLLEDCELSGRAVRFYCKAASHTLEVHPATVSARLRQAARDGWPGVRNVSCGDESMPFADVTVDKNDIIMALEAKRLPVPRHWTGQLDEASRPLTRAAVKQQFPQLAQRQWDKLFERERTSGLGHCRLEHKQGKYVLYDPARIAQWVAARPTEAIGGGAQGEEKRPPTIADELISARHNRT
jgi:hypothetical protein